MNFPIVGAIALLAVTGPCPEIDRSELLRLESQAKALAVTSGCSSAGECRSAPVGAKSCGGPRYYLPYCSLTTDSAALFRTLEELAWKERAYNAEHGIMSDCAVASPPQLVLSSGRCAAAQP